MNGDIFSKERSKSSRRNGYLYYLLNNLISALPPPVKYLILKVILGNIGDKTVIEPGVFLVVLTRSTLGVIYLSEDGLPFTHIREMVIERRSE